MDDVKKLTPEETVEALRHCVNDLPCTECVMYPYMISSNCTMELCAAAAETIEELLAQKLQTLIVPEVALSEEKLAEIREAMKYGRIMTSGEEPSIEVVQQRWIPVTERLPDVWQHLGDDDHIGEPIDFIVFINGALVPTSLWFNGESFFDESGNLYNVTHWQPMPEPPKEV